MISNILVSSGKPLISTGNLLKSTTFTITTSAGAHGIISAAHSAIFGSNFTVVITPDSGYMVDTLTVDGSVVAAAESYAFNNIQADHTVSVTFAVSGPLTYTLEGTLDSNVAGLAATGLGASQAIDGRVFIGPFSSDGTNYLRDYRYNITTGSVEGVTNFTAFGLSNVGGRGFVVSPPAIAGYPDGNIQVISTFGGGVGKLEVYSLDPSRTQTTLSTMDSTDDYASSSPECLVPTGDGLTFMFLNDTRTKLRTRYFDAVTAHPADVSIPVELGVYAIAACPTDSSKLWCVEKESSVYYVAQRNRSDYSLVSRKALPVTYGGYTMRYDAGITMSLNGTHAYILGYQFVPPLRPFVMEFNYEAATWMFIQAPAATGSGAGQLGTAISGPSCFTGPDNKARLLVVDRANSRVKIYK